LAINRQEGELNDEQVAAINHPDSVFLVACPGSGKIRTLTYKIACELSKLNSEKKWVVAITYTNRAAGEIQDRIENMGISTNQLWIGTIHAFCLEWIIKPYGIYHDKLKNGYRIINSHDTEKTLTELCGQCPPPKITHFNCDHFYDSSGINISCKDYLRTNVDSVLSEYQQILEQNQQIDFEHILWYSYQLITQNTSISCLLSKIFSYILVDEYQDTKEIQYQIFSSILRAGEGELKAFVVRVCTQYV
jgi:DNA helicase II / ATP-dependent DNA helicase PcrA